MGRTGYLAAAFAMALAAQPGQAQEAPVPVLATVGMLGDVAAEIGGDCAAVEVLVGPGADPHLYQPTASDVARLQGADLILHVGFGLEGQLGAVLDRLSARRAVVAVAPAAMPAEALIPVDEMAGVDPHLWMDPALWAHTVPVIAAAIAEQRPDCAAAIEHRAAAYAAQLAALSDWVAASVATVPEAQRVLVTAHDAFGYYARAFGLREVAVQGLSTEAEASISDIRTVAATVIAQRVPAVFVETTINPRTIEALIESVTAQGGSLAMGGALFSDALGDAGTVDGTYIGMIHSNTVTIVTALGGTPAPLPTALADWAARWGLAAN